MKWILIYVIMNLANQADPSVLGHKVFDSKEQCEAVYVLAEAKTRAQNPNSFNIGMAGFCVEAEELLQK